MKPDTKTRICHGSLLFLAVLGQTILFAFVWGLFGIMWRYGPLPLPPHFVPLLKLWPSEVTMIVTLLGTALSLMSTSLFAIAFKEAFRHRMHKPISLIELQGGIALARGEFFPTRNFRIALATLGMFGLAQLMTSCWSTLLTPTFFLKIYPIGGMELDLNSSYFESQLHQQLLASGSATLSDSDDNSLKIIDTEGLLSGIASAQLNFGVNGAVSFNGVSYQARTGGVVPVAYGYLGAQQVANPNNTGLNFAGGLVPTNINTSTSVVHGLNSSYSILQQGLTANVTCTQFDPPGPVTSQSISIPISFFSGKTPGLTAYSFQMECDDGTSSQQDYVIRSNNQGLPVSPTGLIYSLVCPSPVNQSQQVNWTQFSVTSQGITDKYSFLQLTTCDIIPQFTTSNVTYVNGSLFVSVTNTTPLTASNGNLALYLASIVDYQALNAQSLTSNSFGDALYSVAVNNTNVLTNGSMDPNFLREMEQYWCGVIEFTGTYLRSGFSAPNNYAEGSKNYAGNLTVVTLGWAPKSPIYLYTTLPVTLFLILTYAAIAYVLYEIACKKGSRFTIFDPTDALHLIMVSSTRVLQPAETGSSEVGPDEKRPVPEEEKVLEGEKLGDFSDVGIQYNHTVNVKLVNVEGGRKRFGNLTEKGFESYKAEDLEKRRSAAGTDDTKSPQEPA